jgi:hypothetical protein
VSLWNINVTRTVIAGISVATVRGGQQTALTLSSQKSFRLILKSAMNVSRWIETAIAENPSYFHRITTKCHRSWVADNSFVGISASDESLLSLQTSIIYLRHEYIRPDTYPTQACRRYQGTDQ